MPVTLASRQLIVQKMDAQFNEDLKMRKDTTVVAKFTLHVFISFVNLSNYKIDYFKYFGANILISAIRNYIQV